AVGLRVTQVALDGLDLVLLEEGGADVVALGREEGEDHAATDEEAVGLGEEVADDAGLGGDLRATEDDDVGPLRVTGRPAQGVDLLEDELAGSVREALGDVVDARLLAVDDTEAVGDEEVGEERELVGQGAA